VSQLTVLGMSDKRRQGRAAKAKAAAAQRRVVRTCACASP